MTDRMIVKSRPCFWFIKERNHVFYAPGYVLLENFHFIFKLWWQLLIELCMSPHAKLMPTHEAITPPNRSNKIKWFLISKLRCFIRFSTLICIAVQVIIRPCKHDSSIQEASLSSNLGNIGWRPHAAFLLFCILDKSFCIFLQPLTSFLLTEKHLAAIMLFVLSAKANTCSLKLAI